MGTPVAFMRAKGPIPIPKAWHAAASTVAMPATPSSTRRQASLR